MTTRETLLEDAHEWVQEHYGHWGGERREALTEFIANGWAERERIGQGLTLEQCVEVVELIWRKDR